MIDAVTVSIDRVPRSSRMLFDSLILDIRFYGLEKQSCRHG
jgi:hypothetical protein